MRAARRDSGLPYTRRQSGPRFRGRFRPNEHQGGVSADEPRFGVRLQEAVADRLERLDVDHETFENGSPYARSERVELRVSTGYPDVPAVEIQYTLRKDVRGKKTDFLRAAIQRADQRTPRVYVEILTGEHMRLNELADQVVRVIRGIVRDIRSLAREPGNVVGLVTRFAKRRAQDPEPFSLFATIGTKARAWLHGLIAAIEATKQAAAEALRRSEAAAKKKLAVERRDSPAVTRNSAVFHMVAALRDRLHGFQPHPLPAYATSQTSHPLRMPFRR